MKASPAEVWAYITQGSTWAHWWPEIGLEDFPGGMRKGAWVTFKGWKSRIEIADPEKRLEWVGLHVNTNVYGGIQIEPGRFRTKITLYKTVVLPFMPEHELAREAKELRRPMKKLVRAIRKANATPPIQ